MATIIKDAAYWNGLISKATNELSALNQQYATIKTSADAWIKLCNTQKCSSSAINTRNERVNQVTELYNQITLKQAELSGYQNSLSEWNKLTPEQQIEQGRIAVNADVNKTRTLIIGGIVIVVIIIIGIYFYKKKKSVKTDK